MHSPISQSLYIGMLQDCTHNYVIRGRGVEAVMGKVAVL